MGIGGASAWARSRGPAIYGWIAVAVSLFATTPAFAARHVYVYRVEEQRFGNIGTFTNIVKRHANAVDVVSKLRVAVKLLGIDFFDESAHREERWKNGRLVYFRGVTDTNGKKLRVTGRAVRDGFLIVSPTGRFLAPAQVHPSNPWSLSVLHSHFLMSTRTGKVTHVVVTDTGKVTATFDGKSLRLRRFFVDGDKHQVVWFDARGIPVAFKTPEHGSPITFILEGFGLSPP